jgi:hypothetical protein
MPPDANSCPGPRPLLIAFSPALRYDAPVKRHLLGLLIALILFLLGVVLVMRDDCRMPWVECDATNTQTVP